jgi:hypothetical protein
MTTTCDRIEHSTAASTSAASAALYVSKKRASEISRGRGGFKERTGRRYAARFEIFNHFEENPRGNDERRDNGGVVSRNRTLGANLEITTGAVACANVSDYRSGAISALCITIARKMRAIARRIPRNSENGIEAASLSRR